MLRVGVDVGGTFTDIFVYDETTGETISAKVPTTPDNQAIGVIQSVEAAEVALADVGFIAHGTTTGTNALLERKGARTALLSRPTAFGTCSRSCAQIVSLATT